MAETTLLSTREAAARIGVSQRTIIRMADDGRLEPVYRGKPLLFTVEAVEARREVERAEVERRFAEPEPSEAQ